MKRSRSRSEHLRGSIGVHSNTNTGRPKSFTWFPGTLAMLNPSPTVVHELLRSRPNLRPGKEAS
jgi:hypothetical protein